MMDPDGRRALSDTDDDRMRDHARKLHESSVFVDGNNQIMTEFAIRKDLGHENVFDDYYAPLLRKGGIDVIDMVVGGNSPCLNNTTDYLTLGALSNMDKLLEEEKDSAEFDICRCHKDIEDALAGGRIAVLMKFEGSRALDGKPDEDDLSLLRTFYRLGLRGVCLVGSARTRVADGPGEDTAGAGLTTFGVKVIEEMNRLGMVVDVAQLTDEGFWDVLEATSKPIVDSHTNTLALCDNPRNISDERILAMGENGGLIGVTFVKGEVKRWATERGEVITFDDVVPHIDHMVGIVGIDHVAIGGDLDDWELVNNVQRCWSPVPGLIENHHIGVPVGSTLIDSPRTVEDYPVITDSLVRHGYSDDDIRKILGLNWLRLYEEVIG